MDNAFSKRLRCIHFPTEFVDNPVEKHQRKIDTKINDKFILWRSDLMLLLIKYYNLHLKNACIILKPTQKILKWTNKYRENADIYLSYITEKTEKSDKNIHCSVLYKNFTDWYIKNNPGKNNNIPSAKKFVAELRKYKHIEDIKVNKKTQLGIKGLAIINEDDSDYDNDE